MAKPGYPVDDRGPAFLVQGSVKLNLKELGIIKNDEVVYTGVFAVKRKTPLLLKVLPVLALGYLAATLGGGSDGPAEIPDLIEPQ